MTICCTTELYKIKYVYIKPKKFKEKGKWAGLGSLRDTLSDAFRIKCWNADKKPETSLKRGKNHKATWNLEQRQDL